MSAAADAQRARDLEAWNASPALQHAAQKTTTKASEHLRSLSRGNGVELVAASSVTPEPIRWLWPGWLARGKLIVLAGQAGTGKTTLAVDWAASVTGGKAFPDGHRPEPGNVLIWSGEDDPKDTLVPRLIAAGAGRSRVFFVGGVKQGDACRPFDPAVDVDHLRKAIAALPGGVSLIIVDPLVSACVGDSHKNAEVRRSLAPLVDMALDVDAALVGITHFSKGTGGRDPLERVTGSLAFGALARVVLGTGKSENGGLIVARCKSNIGPDGGGFAYAFEQVQLPGSHGIEASRIVWGASLEGTASELLATPEADGDGSATSEATEWLRGELESSPMAANDVKLAARNAGFSDKMLRSASDRLRVEKTRDGFGEGSRWLWSLPEGDTRRCPSTPKMPEDAPHTEWAPSQKEGIFAASEIAEEVTEADIPERFRSGRLPTKAELDGATEVEL